MGLDEACRQNFQAYFNDARDNEQRSARHQSRNPLTLMGVNIAGMRNRYPKWQHVDVGPSDYAELSDSVTLQAHTFHPQSGPSNTFIDFQASDIVTAKGKWDTTNAHTYELQQALLIQVLLNTDSEHWSALWLCKLFRQHMVVSFEGAWGA